MKDIPERLPITTVVLITQYTKPRADGSVSAAGDRKSSASGHRIPGLVFSINPKYIDKGTLIHELGHVIAEDHKWASEHGLGNANVHRGKWLNEYTNLLEEKGYSEAASKNPRSSAKTPMRSEAAISGPTPKDFGFTFDIDTGELVDSTSVETKRSHTHQPWPPTTGIYDGGEISEEEAVDRLKKSSRRQCRCIPGSLIPISTGSTT